MCMPIETKQSGVGQGLGRGRKKLLNYLQEACLFLLVACMVEHMPCMISVHEGFLSTLLSSKILLIYISSEVAPVKKK